MEQVADPNFNEMALFHEQKEQFHTRLFQAEHAFEYLHEAFHTWWASLAGGFSIERTADTWMGAIYEELAVMLKTANREPEKTLHISVIFDKCVLTKACEHSYYAVYAIEDFLRHHKKMPSKLLKCFQ